MYQGEKHSLWHSNIEAIQNADRNFDSDNSNRPLKGSTEVYLLAKSMFAVIKNKIRAVKNKL